MKSPQEIRNDLRAMAESLLAQARNNREAAGRTALLLVTRSQSPVDTMQAENELNQRIGRDLGGEAVLQSVAKQLARYGDSLLET